MLVINISKPAAKAVKIKNTLYNRVYNRTGFLSERLTECVASSFGQMLRGTPQRKEKTLNDRKNGTKLPRIIKARKVSIKRG